MRVIFLLYVSVVILVRMATSVLHGPVALLEYAGYVGVREFSSIAGIESRKVEGSLLLDSDGVPFDAWIILVPCGLALGPTAENCQ